MQSVHSPVNEPPKKTVLIHLTWTAPALWHGIRAYAREANWWLIFPQRPFELPRASKDFDGVIVLVGENEVFDTARRFPSARIVDIRGTTGLKSDALVIVDHEKVGRMAADYLEGLGCRSFLGLSLKRTWSGVTERLAAFRHRLKERNHPARFLHYDAWVPNSVRCPRLIKTAIQAAVKRLPAPVGVFCPDDYVADMFLQAALELGYRIPEDIAVLGVNNDRGFCEASLVPLSSIDVNLSKLGYDAAQLLDRLMEGDRRAPRLVRIPPQQVEARRSTERSCCDDKIVRAILEYIRDHFAEKISAEHIIHDIRASRTNAFVRFRKAMGHSIGEEIEKVRIAHARSLLASTDYKIDSVARLCGYLNTSAFCRVFKKNQGKTPSEIRKDRTLP